MHDLGAGHFASRCPACLWSAPCCAALCRQLRALLGGNDDMPPGDAKLLLVMQVVGPLWLPDAGEVAEVRRRLLGAGQQLSAATSWASGGCVATVERTGRALAVACSKFHSPAPPGFAASLHLQVSGAHAALARLLDLSQAGKLSAGEGTPLARRAWIRYILSCSS